MATVVPLPVESCLYTCPTSSSKPSPSSSSRFQLRPKTLTTNVQSCHRDDYHHRRRVSSKPSFLPSAKPLPRNNWYHSRFFVSQGDDHPTLESSVVDEAPQDDVEQPAGDADKKSPLSLKSLLLVYKDAVLNFDDKTASEIEAAVYQFEVEKTDLDEKYAALSAAITSGKEKLVRLQADFDNYRKRSEKEKLSVRSDAKGEVIESLLPMIDNFERAKQQLKLETEKEKKIDASYQGIYKQFVEIMKSISVAVVPTVGKPFDPLVHEAIAREESHEFSEGIVIQEFRRGFVLGDRLLRPAMVKVSAGPGKMKPKPSPTESSDSSKNAVEQPKQLVE